MKKYFQIAILVMIFIPILNSCRQDDNSNESTTEDLIKINKKNSETSKSDTIDKIPPTDPPVKDGQQWKIKK